MNGKRTREILCSRWFLFLVTMGVSMAGIPIALYLIKIPHWNAVGISIGYSIPAIAGFLPNFVRSLREPFPTIASFAIGPFSLAAAISVLSFWVAPWEALQMKISGSILVFVFSLPIILPAAVAGRLCAAPFRKRFLR